MCDYPLYSFFSVRIDLYLSSTCSIKKDISQHLHAEGNLTLKNHIKYAARLLTHIASVLIHHCSGMINKLHYPLTTLFVYNETMGSVTLESWTEYGIHQGGSIMRLLDYQIHIIAWTSQHHLQGISQHYLQHNPYLQGTLQHGLCLITCHYWKKTKCDQYPSTSIMEDHTRISYHAGLFYITMGPLQRSKR